VSRHPSVFDRYAIMCFEHDRRARQTAPSCLELDVDVRVPWTWVEATIGTVKIGSNDLGVNDPDLEDHPTLAKLNALAERYCPKCPECGEPLRYVAWSIEQNQGVLR